MRELIDTIDYEIEKCLLHIEDNFIMKFSVKNLTWDFKTTVASEARPLQFFTLNQTLYKITDDDESYFCELHMFDYNSSVDFEFATKLLKSYYTEP